MALHISDEDIASKKAENERTNHANTMRRDFVNKFEAILLGKNFFLVNKSSGTTITGKSFVIRDIQISESNNDNGRINLTLDIEKMDISFKHISFSEIMKDSLTIEELFKVIGRKLNE